MYERRLLYVNASQLSAFLWQGGVLSEEGCFAAGDAGRQQFAAYLAANAKSVFTMLANVAEEGFHVELIPFLRGANRQSIISRRLGQLFFGATLTTAVSLGYQKSRRKDERVLLAALTRNELFAPWLEVIARAEAPLAGVHSLPLLGPLLLRKLALADERCLLLTVQDQTLRQSYLEKAEVHFSRLTPLQSSSIGAVAQTFASEARKLQQYLVSQRLIGRQEPITAYLLARREAGEALAASCVDSDSLSFVHLDLEHCAEKCGLRTIPADLRCEPLFLHLLASDPPRAQFASDVERHDYHLWLIRSALHGAAAVALFACLLWAGKQLFQAYRIQDEVDGIRAETLLARGRYEEIVRTFPPIPTTTDNLRRVIDRYAEIERGSSSPVDLWREVSHALQGAASVELESLEWKAADSPAVARAPAGAIGASAVQPPPVGETAILAGSLRLGAESKPRQVLAAFNSLVDALKRNPGLEVEVLQQPFDVESGKPLSGGDATSGEFQARPFRIQVRRRVGP
ncbi:hypothetical protein [Accumulibacter sp.]|uniref:hypothetical protein n=1 Tax=Accumulibacter sp. TaxID=2053492 RepID=UPI0025D47E46|nr:hypothetical protein [Accumulibacter sp.]MCM8594718.1 hypothetical protein [Accumulibacter sp.]MCM8625866.1 hypothetical protein [Accumulibacter sp.]MDS4048864.1 hypothetical protein [Accumulibacter sp.]